MKPIDLTRIPEVRNHLNVAANLTASGKLPSFARSAGEDAAIALLEAMGLTGKQLVVVRAFLDELWSEGESEYDLACKRGDVVNERAELLERLVSGDEPTFSAERDTRAHDSYATELT